MATAGLQIGQGFYPAVMTGSSNTRFFYSAVRTGSSNTHFVLLCFLVVTCPRPPVFARPNKYSLHLLLHRLGARILSGRYIFCTLGKGQQRRGLMPLGLFLFCFWWSLAPDLRFSLGQTNHRRKLPLYFLGSYQE